MKLTYSDKPEEIKDIVHIVIRSYNRKSFDFGLSTLHAHLCIFECLLHISYLLNLKTWLVCQEYQTKFKIKKI